MIDFNVRPTAQTHRSATASASTQPKEGASANSKSNLVHGGKNIYALFTQTFPGKDTKVSLESARKKAVDL
jgi:hypothetical protein